jgi:hypothetical protein
MNAPENSWVKEFAGEVTICDPDGIITEMNDRSAEALAGEGGRALIGRNVLDCHPEPARSQLKHMLEARQSNVYTIEKNGVKKFIYQTPWYHQGEYAGFMELIVEIPFEMPHFLRA